MPCYSEKPLYDKGNIAWDIFLFLQKSFGHRWLLAWYGIS